MLDLADVLRTCSARTKSDGTARTALSLYEQKGNAVGAARARALLSRRTEESVDGLQRELQARSTSSRTGRSGASASRSPSDGTDKILVSLVHGADLRSQPVKDPKQKPWTVDFADNGSPFAIGDEVFVVGVAHRVGHDPFVWQGGFEISGQGLALAGAGRQPPATPAPRRRRPRAARSPLPGAGGGRFGRMFPHLPRR